MARPRSFHEADALDAAMSMFWLHGYDGVGIADLIDAMGILRGSLYKAWGSKKALFLACLDRYDSTRISPGLAFLAGHDAGAGLSGLERINTVFSAHDPRGCMMCNAAAGPAGTDADVAEWVRDCLDRLRGAFEEALRDADVDGADLTTEADRLTQRYVGMRVQQRAEDQNYLPTP
jgi:AcrR family transcriptional regulator